MFLFPPSCHAFLPLSIRPTRAMRDIFLKIFFNSPEINSSIIFSMYLFSITKKNQFLRYIIVGEWIFSLVQHRSKFFSNKYSFCGWAGRISSFWFCVGLWSACKILRIEFQRIFFDLNFWNFLLNVVQIHHKLVWSMKNSDARESTYCLYSKTSFWSQFHVYCASNWLWLPIQVHFWCSLGSILSVVMLRLLVECIHDKLSQRTVLQCISLWNTVRLQQYSEILHPYRIYSIYLVVIASQFVLQITAKEDLR